MKDLYMNIKAKTGNSTPENREKAGELYLSFLNMNKENKRIVSSILNLCSFQDFKLKVNIIDSQGNSQKLEKRFEKEKIFREIDLMIEEELRSN